MIITEYMENGSLDSFLRVGIYYYLVCVCAQGKRHYLDVKRKVLAMR